MACCILKQDDLEHADRWQHDGGGQEYDPFDTEGVMSGSGPAADHERRLAGDQWFAAQHAQHAQHEASRHSVHPAPTIFIKAL